MSRWVVDASVVVKWALPDRDEEDHVPAALALLSAIRDGRAEVFQPPHWLAEVAGVLARLRPEVAPRVAGLLHALELPVIEGPAVYARACTMADRLGAHVFDTLYHAVALEERGLVLVTADERYYRKASREGAIRRLADIAA